MDSLRLIVGLGNPEERHARTRHNAGFLAVEGLAERWGWAWRLEERFRSRTASGERKGLRLLMCEPQTYMNVSGEAVGRLAGFYRVTADRVMVVVDDADLPLGTIRLRPGGSSGGHHGLESVEQALGTRDYPRLRIGIGRKSDGLREITGHVLGRFTAAETRRLKPVLDRVGDQIECWLDAGIGKAMSQFNGVLDDPGKEE
jgi:PTH1 family peptidyl-tRNA hydrolase